MSMQRNNKKGKITKEEYSLKLKKTVTNKWLISCAVFVLSTFLVIGIPIIINELYKSNSGYLTLWGAEDVLAFYAVILSGIITIGALIATIYFTKKDTEKHIKFSKSQTKTPFFLISNVYQANNPGDIYESKNGLTWRKEYIINKYGTNQGQIVITLKNIGEGIALSPFCEINLLQKTNEETFPAFVNKGDNLEIIYNLQNILESKFGSPTFPNGFEAFDSCITLRYQNTLGIRFNQKIIFQHEWNIERNSAILLVNSISPQNIES